MTREEAESLISLTPESAFTLDLGMGRGADHGYAAALKKKFPEFNWRVILDRSGEYTRWRLTIEDNDPREHYVPAGGTCIHCGKTARELGVKERDEDGREVEPQPPPPCAACGRPADGVRGLLCPACWLQAEVDP